MSHNIVKDLLSGVNPVVRKDVVTSEVVSLDVVGERTREVVAAAVVTSEVVVVKSTEVTSWVVKGDDVTGDVVT